MASYKNIYTPHGMILADEKNLRSSLVFYTDVFLGIEHGGYGGARVKKWGGAFLDAQIFVDNEVLSTCDPYIPKLTGMLIASGILGTKVGSGLVQWIAPYAAAQYYMVRVNPSITGPLRGPFWFERMKEVFGRAIVKGAKKIFRGRTR